MKKPVLMFLWFVLLTGTILPQTRARPAGRKLKPADPYDELLRPYVKQQQAGYQQHISRLQALNDHLLAHGQELLHYLDALKDDAANFEQGQDMLAESTAVASNVLAVRDLLSIYRALSCEGDRAAAKAIIVKAVTHYLHQNEFSSKSIDLARQYVQNDAIYKAGDRLTADIKDVQAELNAILAVL